MNAPLHSNRVSPPLHMDDNSIKLQSFSLPSTFTMNQLKEAEKKASLLVQESRKARVDRMKEAKSEAEQIIAAYRADMEASYQSKLHMQNTAGGSVGNALNSTTAGEISSMSNDFKSRRAGVEQMLVDLVLKVNPVAPQARPVL